MRAVDGFVRTGEVLKMIVSFDAIPDNDDTSRWRRRRHKTKAQNTDPTTTALEKTAILCDKYDAIASFWK